MKNLNIRFLAAFLFCWSLIGSVQAKTVKSLVPPILKGVWYEDTDVGRAQCRLYLKHKTTDNLLGALVFYKRSFRTYAEYGEGNYSVVTVVKRLKQNTWQVKDKTYMDADNQAVPSTQLFAIKNKQLYWTYEFTVDGKGMTHTKEFFRCK